MTEQVKQPDTADLPGVCVVVLHWRGIEHTRNCLRSLRTLSYPRFEVLLVDNGSPERDGERLQQEFSEISLVRLPDNFGFSGGCNAGIDYGLNRDTDFIWLLNNDAVVVAATLPALVDAAIADPSAGATGAVIIEDGDNADATASGKGCGVIDFRHAKSHLEPPTSEHVTACDWLSGSSLLLRATALRDAGKLNDRYFLYFEDVELCHRLRQHGWRCLLAPRARVQHAGYASTSGERVLWRYYYGARNRLYFFHQYATGLTWLNCMLRLFGRLLRHMLGTPFLSGDKRIKLRGEYLGTRDFITGKYGKADFL
jgi:GT2 family glycosyltransferase